MAMRSFDQKSHFFEKITKTNKKKIKNKQTNKQKTSFVIFL